jgi:uncharacterized surface protein with fasciclin (FAS1) repeats
MKAIATIAALIAVVAIIGVGSITGLFMATAPETRNIAEVAQEAGSFNTLLAAVDAAGLTETLSTGGPFTVFAPTDEAFAALPEGTVESLLQNTDALTNVLTYHVVSGKAMSSDVVNLDSVATLQGQSLSIDTSNGVRVNNARVILADIEASNGVIHVIDKVLIPQ